MSTVTTTIDTSAKIAATVVSDAALIVSSAFAAACSDRDDLWLVYGAYCATHVHASSAGDGAGRRSGTALMRVAHWAALKVRVEHVQLSCVTQSNGHVVGLMPSGCIAGSAIYATRVGIGVDPGLFRHTQLDITALVCGVAYMGASESSASAVVAEYGMQAGT